MSRCHEDSCERLLSSQRMDNACERILHRSPLWVVYKRNKLAFVDSWSVSCASISVFFLVYLIAAYPMHYLIQACNGKRKNYSLFLVIPLSSRFKELYGMVTVP